MTDTGLMTIGSFSRSTGLTAGALRFYADSGVLVPARVDESTGYRYYTEGQIDRAVTIRRLRDMGMALNKISEVLAGGTGAIDRHVTQLAEDAQRARRIAGELRRALGSDERHHTMITVNGPVFANAVEYVLAATAHLPEAPVLAGVYVEMGSGALTLTATDRYRLSTRTMPVDSAEAVWSAVVDGDDLRTALPFVRSRHRLTVVAGTSGVDFVDEDGACRQCRVLAETFPDYRGMLDGLPAVVTRVVAPRTPLVRALEESHERYIEVVAREGLRIGGMAVPATVTGPLQELAFDMTTLYPAVASAVGPDVMIDISGPASPVLVRSADNGDLRTIAMPVEPSLVGG